MSILHFSRIFLPGAGADDRLFGEVEKVGDWAAFIGANLLAHTSFVTLSAAERVNKTTTTHSDCN